MRCLGSILGRSESLSGSPVLSRLSMRFAQSCDLVIRSRRSVSLTRSKSRSGVTEIAFITALFASITSGKGFVDPLSRSVRA